MEPLRPQHSDRRFCLPKGGMYMPITITFHLFGFTVTIRITCRNRHSAK